MFRTMNPELPLRMTIFPVLVYTATGSKNPLWRSNKVCCLHWQLLHCFMTSPDSQMFVICIFREFRPFRKNRVETSWVNWQSKLSETVVGKWFLFLTTGATNILRPCPSLPWERIDWVKPQVPLKRWWLVNLSPFNDITRQARLFFPPHIYCKDHRC